MSIRVLATPRLARKALVAFGNSISMVLSADFDIMVLIIPLGSSTMPRFVPRFPRALHSYWRDVEELFFLPGSPNFSGVGQMLADRVSM